MSKSGHFEAAAVPDEMWKGIQQHLGYSDKELERLKKGKFAKVLPVMASPAIQGKSMVVEVVESHGCAEGMKPGDKLYFTGCSNLDPTRSTRWCAYNMSHITNFANLCHNMLLQGLDPNLMYSNHFSCMDCGSEHGLGLVISKVTIVDEPKK
jgi:uncharacterized repeat protein (TIGR04076 family)